MLQRHRAYVAAEDCGAWKKEYNEERPHSSLGYKTPTAFAASLGGQSCGKDAAFGNVAENAEFPLSPNSNSNKLSLREKIMPEGVA